MNEAQERNERQRKADMAHHEGRLDWLSCDSPRYACGALVAPSDAAQMLKASREALRLIAAGMSTNHAPL